MTGSIHGKQKMRAWVFGADESPAARLMSPGRASYVEARAIERLSPRTLEDLVRSAMGEHSILLKAGQIGDVPKECDLASGVALRFLTDSGELEHLISLECLA
jgi:hypothetical protein